MKKEKEDKTSKYLQNFIEPAFYDIKMIRKGIDSIDEKFEILLNQIGKLINSQEIQKRGKNEKAHEKV